MYSKTLEMADLVGQYNREILSKYIVVRLRDNLRPFKQMAAGF